MEPFQTESAEAARLYDWEHDAFRDDLELHVALARRFGGPVLELGCGTGRVLQALAEAGIACDGIDQSPAMLDRARLRLQRVGWSGQLFEQSVEHLSLAGHYRTILWPLDGLALLLDRSAQLAALAAARAHATHDGRLVVDVSNGNLRGGNEPPEELVHQRTAPDMDSGRPTTKWVIRRPDPVAQLDELTFFYDELDAGGLVHRTIIPLCLRWFGRFELELLLERAGWEVRETYGSYALDPFGTGSDRIILVATPAAS